MEESLSSQQVASPAYRLSIIRQGTHEIHTYLFRRWHLLNLLIENFLYSSPHCGDWMIWAIEGDTILEDQPNICNELVRMIVTGIGRIGIRFDGVGGGKFAIDGGKIHRLLDDGGVQWDIERDMVDRVIERLAVLQFLQCANCRCTETMLRSTKRRNTMDDDTFGCRGRRHGGWGWSCRLQNATHEGIKISTPGTAHIIRKLTLEIDAFSASEYLRALLAGGGLSSSSLFETVIEYGEEGVTESTIVALEDAGGRAEADDFPFGRPFGGTGSVSSCMFTSSLLVESCTSAIFTSSEECPFVRGGVSFGGSPEIDAFSQQ